MPPRPARPEDREDVLRLLAARDQVDFGDPQFTRSLLLDQWRSRDFQIGRDAAVVGQAGGLAGFAAAFSPGDLAFVDPAREGEGIGTELLRWIESRGCPRGTFRQRVGSGNRRARSLLESAGYQYVRTVHYLGWNGQPALPIAPPPEGIALDPVSPIQDAATLHELDRHAFSENADYHPETLGSFCDEHLASPELHSASSRIARRSDRPVGFVLSRRSGNLGYIDLLAVIPEARRLGLGRALLCHALSTLAGEGAEEVTLDVASDNPGALNLYHAVGMRPRHELVVFEKPAREL